MPDEPKPKMPTQYRRTFTLQSAHLNNQEAYDNLGTALDDEDFPALMSVLTNIHGHNFKVDVTITGFLGKEFDYLVDDRDIALFMEKFDNANLSLIPPFGPHKRATTENLAEHFAEQIWGMVGDNVSYVGVFVSETESINASAARGR